MVVLDALRRALAALARSPVVLAVTGLAALLQLPAFVAGALDPPVAVAVSTVFNLGFIVVLPFVQGGFLAVADAALAAAPSRGGTGTRSLDGATAFETLLAAGRENYVQLLVGYAVLLGVNVVLGVGAVLLALVGGGLLLVLAPDPTGLLVLAGLALLALVILLAYLVVVFVVQFYAHAIVLDDDRAIEGFRRSARLVRANPWAVTGYSVVVGVPAGLFGAAVGGASLLFAPPTGVESLGLPQLSLAGRAAVLLGVLVLTTLFTAVFLLYSVAFYRGLRDREPGGSAPEPDRR